MPRPVLAAPQADHEDVYGHMADEVPPLQHPGGDEGYGPQKAVALLIGMLFIDMLEAAHIEADDGMGHRLAQQHLRLRAERPHVGDARQLVVGIP